MNTKFTIRSTSYTPTQIATLNDRKVRVWERRDLRDGGWVLAGTFSTKRNATKLDVINAAPASAALQEINEEIAQRNTPDRNVISKLLFVYDYLDLGTAQRHAVDDAYEAARGNFRERDAR